MGGAVVNNADATQHQRALVVQCAGRTFGQGQGVQMQAALRGHVQDLIVVGRVAPQLGPIPANPQIAADAGQAGGAVGIGLQLAQHIQARCHVNQVGFGRAVAVDDRGAQLSCVVDHVHPGM
ncbi:MAG: hypothetical protein R3F15_04930 [Lysobacterales bacterium]